jgi:hypothetical protein
MAVDYNPRRPVDAVFASVLDLDATDATLAAAKEGDRDASALVIQSFETSGSYSLMALAARTLRRMLAGSNDKIGQGHRDDAYQEAVLMVLKCLDAFEGSSLLEFKKYAYRSVNLGLVDHIRPLIGGTDDDPDGKKLFATLFAHFSDADAGQSMTNSDYAALAEAAMQDRKFLAEAFPNTTHANRATGAERAYAARMSFQGAVSMEMPVAETGETLGALLGDTMGVPGAVDVEPSHGYRPITWVQAVEALERHILVPRDAALREKVFTALDRFRAGTVTATDVEFFEAIRCHSEEFGTAVAMLRAVRNRREEAPAASEAENMAAFALGQGSSSVRNAQDRLAAATDRVVQRALTRRVIASMSQTQAYILTADHGFAGMGSFKDDAAIARAMKAAGIADMAPAQVRKNRVKANASFAKRWTDLVAKTGSERAALEAAALKAGVSLDAALTEED